MDLIKALEQYSNVTAEEQLYKALIDFAYTNAGKLDLPVYEQGFTYPEQYSIDELLEAVAEFFRSQ